MRAGGAGGRGASGEGGRGGLVGGAAVAGGPRTGRGRACCAPVREAHTHFNRGGIDGGVGAVTRPVDLPWLSAIALVAARRPVAYASQA